MVARVCQCIGEAVAIKGVCASRTTCTVYLNDVGGVSARMFEELVDDENPTAEDVLNSLIAESGSTFVQSFLSAISDKKTERTIIKTINTSRWDSELTSIAKKANTYRGAKIYLQESPYLYANVAEVQIYSSGGGSATEPLYVYDLDTGEIVNQYTFNNAVAGYKTISINTKFTGYQWIGVVYNAANVETRRVDNYPYSYYSELCESCGCTATHASCVEFDSTKPITHDNGTGAENCGIRITYSIGCSIEGYICTNKAHFAEGFKYAVAMELFTRVDEIDDLNRTTAIDPKKLERWYNKAAHKLGMFFKNTANGISLDCGVCFPCAPTASSKWGWAKP